jgi:hypothetical protein
MATGQAGTLTWGYLGYPPNVDSGSGVNGFERHLIAAKQVLLKRRARRGTLTC